MAHRRLSPYRLRLRWQWYWLRWSVRQRRRQGLRLPLYRTARVLLAVVGLSS